MRSSLLVPLAALALCVGPATGCNNDQIEPPSTATESGGPGTTSTSSTGSTTDAPTGGPGSSTSGETTADTSGSSGETTATSGGVDCEGPDGCFNCAPTKPVEVLNACTDATCEPFDNKARLPLLRGDGTLPPLP